MTIVYFSSVFNHHSMPLCDALNRLPGVTCYFVATREEEAQRKTLGYHAYSRDYVINMLESEECREKAYRLAIEADVMIAGVFPYEVLKERLQRGKLTFLCQERMFKGGANWIRRAKAWFFNVRKYSRFSRKPLYLLAIGRGTAQDYKSIGFYRKKSFCWAYFPPFIQYNVQELMDKKESNTIRILFAGRMIPLKHPEYVLRATKTLREKGYNVHLTYVGTGEMEDSLRQEAAVLGESVSFLGAMSPEQVRDEMEKANIFVFTSNSMEGWGAVVNEAMNAGCAIVAGSEPGAVKTMVVDGNNGFVYHQEDYDQFYEKLERLVKDKQLTRQLGEAAYKTIENLYNADVAAQRFCQQVNALLNNKSICSFEEGPMQRL